MNLRSRVSPEPLAEVDRTEWFRICRCPAGALLAANLRARAAAGGCFRACSSWHVLRRAGLPKSSTGTMLQSKQPYQRKRQTTSGSARPARSRAISTPMRVAGCTSTRKASSTTARRSPSREKLLLSKPANPRLTQWATPPKCSPAAKTPPTLAWVCKPYRFSAASSKNARQPVDRQLVS